MTLIETQKRKIADNLRAFEYNFGPVRIERIPYTGYFNVYYPADKKNSEYIQQCPNIDYLNGWLYGCVQGVLRKELRDGYLAVAGEER